MTISPSAGETRAALGTRGKYRGAAVEGHHLRLGDRGALLAFVTGRGRVFHAGEG